MDSNQAQMNLDSQFKKMGFDPSQLNNLVELVNNDVMCGPSCQREKKLEELRVKMIKAEKNLDNAPENLASARRNYYEFKDGKYNYNNSQKSKFRIDAEKELRTIQKEFDNRSIRTQTMINEYEALLAYNNNMDELLNTEITKNQRLSKDIDTIKAKIFTNDRRYHYFDESIEWQEKLNFFVKLAYYGLIVYFVVYYLIYKGNYTNRKKVIYGLILTAIPFIFNFVITFELFGISIKLILDRIVSLFTGNQFPTE
jgi:membrane-associated HD superfamily phosphohydrolase